MELAQIAIEIEKRINAMEVGRKQLGELSSARAVAIAEYDRDLAIHLMKLRNGKPFTLDGETIKDPPATVLEKIAKGIIWESRLRLEEAEAAYKCANNKLDVLQSQLNGLQSIYRRQNEV